MSNQHRRCWSVIAGLAVSLTTIGCGSRTTAQVGQAPVPGPPTVETVQVVEQLVAVTLDMPGELDPYETVAIYPRATGFVKTIRVDRGSHVKTGDLLVQIEAPELAAQRAEAQSKLQAATAQLAVTRAKADADASTYDKLKAASATPGVVAGNDLVLAQKAVEVDQSQIAAAQQNVEAARQAVQSVTDMENYLRMTAPFDGVITERNVHPGALVGPASGAGAATPMLRLVRNDRLRLVVPVPQAYIGSVKEGTSVAFIVPEFPGQTFTGSIARVAHTVDVKTRTMAVELDVSNADGRLASGTFCQVRWPVHRSTPSLFVPSRSVASTTDRTFVVRVRNSHAEWVDVQTGLTTGALIEVFGDLKAGDDVLARGTDEVRPGTEVRAKAVKLGA